MSQEQAIPLSFDLGEIDISPICKSQPLRVIFQDGAGGRAELPHAPRLNLAAGRALQQALADWISAAEPRRRSQLIPGGRLALQFSARAVLLSVRLWPLLLALFLLGWAFLSTIFMPNAFRSTLDCLRLPENRQRCTTVFTEAGRRQRRIELEFQASEAGVTSCSTYACLVARQKDRHTVLRFFRGRSRAELTPYAEQLQAYFQDPARSALHLQLAPVNTAQAIRWSAAAAGLLLLLLGTRGSLVVYHRKENRLDLHGWSLLKRSSQRLRLQPGWSVQVDWPLAPPRRRGGWNLPAETRLVSYLSWLRVLPGGPEVEIHPGGAMPLSPERACISGALSLETAGGERPAAVIYRTRLPQLGFFRRWLLPPLLACALMIFYDFSMAARLPLIQTTCSEVLPCILFSGPVLGLLIWLGQFLLLRRRLYLSPAWILAWASLYWLGSLLSPALDFISCQLGVLLLALPPFALSAHLLQRKLSAGRAALLGLGAALVFATGTTALLSSGPALDLPPDHLQVRFGYFFQALAQFLPFAIGLGAAVLYRFPACIARCLAAAGSESGTAVPDLKKEAA